MEFITVGKIVNTHGIKGEMRILSSLDMDVKKSVFKIGSFLYVEEKAYEIKSYRVHKNYDMVTFVGYDNINDILFLKHKIVKKNIADISLDDGMILDEELKKYKVLTSDGKLGLIKEIEKTGTNYKVLRLEIEGKEILLPYHQDFILKIDQQNKIITVKLL